MSFDSVLSAIDIYCVGRDGINIDYVDRAGYC
jgi:hypothetical protein